MFQARLRVKLGHQINGIATESRFAKAELGHVSQEVGRGPQCRGLTQTQGPRPREMELLPLPRGSSEDQGSGLGTAYRDPSRGGNGTLRQPESRRPGSYL